MCNLQLENWYCGTLGDICSLPHASVFSCSANDACLQQQRARSHFNTQFLLIRLAGLQREAFSFPVTNQLRRSGASVQEHLNIWVCLFNMRQQFSTVERVHHNNRKTASMEPLIWPVTMATGRSGWEFNLSRSRRLNALTQQGWTCSQTEERRRCCSSMPKVKVSSSAMSRILEEGFPWLVLNTGNTVWMFSRTLWLCSFTLITILFMKNKKLEQPWDWLMLKKQLWAFTAIWTSGEEQRLWLFFAGFQAGFAKSLSAQDDTSQLAKAPSYDSRLAKLFTNVLSWDLNEMEMSNTASGCGTVWRHTQLKCCIIFARCVFFRE